MSKIDDLHASITLMAKALFLSMLEDGYPIASVQLMANKLQGSVVDALRSAGADSMVSPMHQSHQPHQSTDENPFQ